MSSAIINLRLYVDPESFRQKAEASCDHVWLVNFSSAKNQQILGLQLLIILVIEYSIDSSSNRIKHTVRSIHHGTTCSRNSLSTGVSKMTLSLTLVPCRQ